MKSRRLCVKIDAFATHINLPEENMNKNKRVGIVLTIIVSVALYYVFFARTTASPFAFAVAADIRSYAGENHDTPRFFRGACETIAALDSTAFMVSPGDIDPVQDVR